MTDCSTGVCGNSEWKQGTRTGDGIKLGVSTGVLMVKAEEQ